MRPILLAILTLTLLSAPTLRAADRPPLYVNPATGNDANDGTPAKPLASVTNALTRAADGTETIIYLAPGNYGALTITTKSPLTLEPIPAKQADPSKPSNVIFEKIAITGAENVQLHNLAFTIPDAKTDKHVYVQVSKSKHVQLHNLQIAGDINDDWAAKKSVGYGISDSEDVTVSGGFVHHTQFGITVSRVNKITVQNIDIGPFREDGVRFKNCDGVLCENAHIHDAHKTKAEHCDGIQMIFWSHNVILRNNRIHNVNQGIGAFAEDGQKRRNWRIEGNLIYSIYNPNTLSIYDADAPVIINNTLPHAGPILKGTTGAIVKNNIFAVPGAAISPDIVKEEDYNLFISAGKTKDKPRGEHDLVGVDPQFVDAEKFDFRLKPTSPAIDSGTPDDKRDKDQLGHPPHKSPDRGALEYVPAPTK